jgi:glycosyltransferase involved in cell wall biosynthesis
MMRVVYFVGTLGAGGLERYVSRIAQQAKTRGDIEPVIVCLHRRSGMFLDELLKAHVPVYEAPEGWRRSPRQWWKLRGLIRDLRPDIVHSQVNFSLVQQFLAVRLGSRSAFCVTERSCYRLHGTAHLRRLIQFHFLRLLRGNYSANGPEVAAHVSNLMKVKVHTIPVLPNGVPMVIQNEQVREAIRARLGWTADDIAIGYVARMHPDKRHRLFLDVVHDLRMRNLPVKVCLAGDGPLPSARRPRAIHAGTRLSGCGKIRRTCQ